MKKMMKTLVYSFTPVLVFLAGCASNVSVDYDEKSKFPDLQRFMFKQAESKPAEGKDDNLQMSSSLVAKRIESAIKNRLKIKGMQYTETEPDFYVVYHVRVKQEIGSHGNTYSFGFGGYGGRGGIGMLYRFPDNEVYSYERSVLTIDILSAPQQELIWRGSSSRALGRVTTPEKTSKMVNEVVDEILELFPPKPKKP